MLKKFQQYINEHHLANGDDTILIALSGGADSVALLDLFIKAKFKVATAHCNFKLRGEESDEDEAFVKKLAKKYNVPIHITHFETIEYADNNKISIEMAARELRYHWFDQLLKGHNYQKIATGHHLNDSIETLFLNLSRGTGYAGLKGIPSKNGYIIRPLLYATKDDIESYSTENNLSYRTDSSTNQLNFFVI